MRASELQLHGGAKRKVLQRVLLQRAQRDGDKLQLQASGLQLNGFTRLLKLK